MCLGIALASGAPLFSGIIAGIIGGILVGFISGSQLGVSGPAAGLAIIVATSISELGAFDVFLAAVVIAGFLQILLGVLKAGIIGYYFPNSVIKGMLAGIGIIIILKEIPHAFGYDKDAMGDLDFWQQDGENTFSELWNMVDFVSPAAMVVTAISLVILIVWEQGFMKKLAWTSLVQGPLVAVSAGIAYTLFTKDTAYEMASEHLVNLPVAKNFSDFGSQFTLPRWEAFGQYDIWITGAVIALVASLETLLCVEAADKLDPLKRITPTNRELIAQGIGNMVSGLIGGIPITQVIVRSSASIQSGGRTKVVAILHGVLILISVSLVPGLLNLIPLATLAAILLVVGYKLAKPVVFTDMYARGKEQFIPFMATVLVLVFTDMLIGIITGLGVAILFILRSSYRTPYFIHEEEWDKSKVIKIELAQEVNFLNKAGIQQSLDHLPNGSHVIVDASKSLVIDPDVHELLQDFASSAANRNITFELLGLTTEEVPNALGRFKSAMKRRAKRAPKPR